MISTARLLGSDSIVFDRSRDASDLIGNLIDVLTDHSIDFVDLVSVDSPHCNGVQHIVIQYVKRLLKLLCQQYGDLMQFGSAYCEGLKFHCVESTVSFRTPPGPEWAMINKLFFSVRTSVNGKVYEGIERSVSGSQIRLVAPCLFGSNFLSLMDRRGPKPTGVPEIGQFLENFVSRRYKRIG